jgi:hypothetical protein
MTIVKERPIPLGDDLALVELLDSGTEDAAERKVFAFLNKRSRDVGFLLTRFKHLMPGSFMAWWEKDRKAAFDALKLALTALLDPYSPRPSNDDRAYLRDYIVCLDVFTEADVWCMLKKVADDHIAGTIIKSDERYAEVRAMDGGEALVNIQDQTIISRQDCPSVLALNPNGYGSYELEEGDPHRDSVNMDIDQNVYARLLCSTAKGLNERFQATAYDVLKSVPGLDLAAIHAAPVKLPDRCAEKVLEYCNPKEKKVFPRCAHILDVIRYSVTCDGPQQILDCKKAIEDADCYKVARIKNKFHHNVDSAQYRGYRDIIVNIVFKAGGRSIIGEVQLVDVGFMKIKKLTHKLYKVERSHTVQDLRKGLQGTSKIAKLDSKQ